MVSPYYRWQDDILTLHCHIQPGAKRSEFCGQHGARLKLRIAAAAVDGKANAGLIEFVAKAFAVSKGEVAIETGAQSRQKTLKIRSPKRLPTELAIAPAQD